MSMKISPLLVFFIIALSFFPGWSQTVEKHIHDREASWLSCFNQTRLTDKFSISVDVQYRMTDNFTDRPLQFLFRPLNAQFGYLNVYQQGASGNNYLSTHAIRLFVFDSLDLRHKEEHK